jgi:hypothetical protein
MQDAEFRENMAESLYGKLGERSKELSLVEFGRMLVDFDKGIPHRASMQAMRNIHDPIFLRLKSNLSSLHLGFPRSFSLREMIVRNIQGWKEET